jgi:hypothetical protein
MRSVLTCALGTGAAATSEKKAATRAIDRIEVLPVNIGSEWFGGNAQGSGKIAEV